MPNTFQRAMQRVARGLFGVTFGTPGAETWQYAQDWLRGQESRSGLLDEPYRKHAVIAKAISCIAEDAASVPWQIFPQGSDEPLEEHEVLTAWEMPNSIMNGLQLWIGTYVSHQLWGEAFWWFPDGIQAGIMLLDPRKVIHKVDESGVAWMLRKDGVDIPLDPDTLTQFKRWNPYSPGGVRGLSKVEAIIVEAAGDYAAASWNTRFFSESNGIPSGLLIPSTDNPAGSTQPDQRRMMLDTWNQRHGGSKRRVGMLPAGWTWQDLGVSQRDMDFRALRDYSREEILGMFGVPPFIAGVLDKANYANARSQKEVYWQGTITRFLGSIEATLNADFLPKVGFDMLEARPQWSVVKALVEDMAEKVEMAKGLWSMGVPFDQINERLEMGFDTDQIEGSDVAYLPFSVVPASEAGMPTATPLPPGMPEEQDEGDQQRALLVHGDPEVRRTLIWKNLVARTRDLESAFNRIMRVHFKALERETLENINSVKGFSARRKGNPEDIVFDLDEANRSLQRRVKPTQERIFLRGGESVIADLGLGVSFDMLDPNVLAKLAQHQVQIVGINERLAVRLRELIGELIEQGAPVEEIARAIRQEFGTTIAQSRRVARTETGMAFNSARNVGMKQVGVEQHQWLSSRDPDVRDSHVSEDGAVSVIGEPFPATGLLYPLDPSGPAREIINCRCVALPVVR